jgi:hypothetical protein
MRMQRVATTTPDPIATITRAKATRRTHALVSFRPVIAAKGRRVTPNAEK